MTRTDTVQFFPVFTGFMLRGIRDVVQSVFFSVLSTRTSTVPPFVMTVKSVTLVLESAATEFLADTSDAGCSQTDKSSSVKLSKRV